jgi:hypothetical protein
MGILSYVQCASIGSSKYGRTATIGSKKSLEINPRVYEWVGRRPDDTSHEIDHVVLTTPDAHTLLRLVAMNPFLLL